MSRKPLRENVDGTKTIACHQHFDLRIIWTAERCMLQSNQPQGLKLDGFPYLNVKLSIERNPFAAKNQTIWSHQSMYISPHE